MRSSGNHIPQPETTRLHPQLWSSKFLKLRNISYDLPQSVAIITHVIHILCGFRQSRAISSTNLATASTFTPLYIPPPHGHLLPRLRFTLAPPLSSSSSFRATVAGVHRRRRRTATCLLFSCLSSGMLVPQLFLSCSFLSTVVSSNFSILNCTA